MKDGAKNQKHKVAVDALSNVAKCAIVLRDAETAEGAAEERVIEAVGRSIRVITFANKRLTTKNAKNLEFCSFNHAYERKTCPFQKTLKSK